MKKRWLIFISLLVSIFTFLTVYVSLDVNVRATDTQYETPDVISIYDLNKTKSIVLTENTRFNYNKKAEYGSLVFKFDMEMNAWDGNQNLQIYFVLNDGVTAEYWWIDHNAYLFKSAGTYISRQKDDGSFTFRSSEALTKENHSIEVGRLAILDNKVATGNYYVYIKVDGNIVDSTVNTYDYNQFTDVVFLTGKSTNTNRYIDPDYIEPTYEDADNISISDLTKNGKSVGNKVVIAGTTEYKYDRNATYGSTIFTFTYKNPNWKVDGDGSQIHFYSTYQEHGMFWLRPDKVRIAYKNASGNVQYVSGPTISSGEHSVEVGRLAIMQGDVFTGSHYFYVVIDGTKVLEKVLELDEKYYTSNSVFITGNNNNMMLDSSWSGDSITYVSNGEIVDQFVTTNDYLTKPEDPSVEGKRFLGWFDYIGNKWDFSTDKVTGDMTLTAGFETIQTISDEQYFADDTFTPILRFTVASDVHVRSGVSISNTYLQQMFVAAYKYSENASTYTNLDATLFVGDVSDDGSEAALNSFKRICEAGIKSGTLLVVSMGNHDFGLSKASQSIERFEEIFQTASDLHIVINGYHFIALSPGTDDGGHFTEDKVKWLDEQLASAVQADPNKPIFVMQHEGVKGTVYGTNSWGVTELTDVLCKYPQVVDFSGHSHYPISDPRSIWQGTFTALGTGTLRYYEMGINGYKNDHVFPTDKTGGWASMESDGSAGSEFMFVEVDANNAIRIILYDLANDCEITRYYIRNAMDERKTKYSFDERSEDNEKPYFENDAEIYASVEENVITLEFDQAKCSEVVESYKIELYKNNKLVDTDYALSCYFTHPAPDKIIYTIPFLEANTLYTIKVYATNAWGNESDTYLTVTTQTESIVVYEDVIDEISLDDLYSVSSKKQLTTETLNKYLQAYFIPSEDNVYGSFKLTMQLLYISESFQICFNEEFDNSDLVWLNNNNSYTYFIKDNLKIYETVQPGLHIVEYGRYHITSGEHIGYTAFYVKIDGELLHETISERQFTTNGHICLNFNSCYAAGSRYYDIDYKIPVTTTPNFKDGSDITLSSSISDWSTTGGCITITSTNSTLDLWLESSNGAVSDKETIKGMYTIGTDGDFYTYEIKTNSFKVKSGCTGNETVTKVCCDTANWKLGTVQTIVYQQEKLDEYDKLNVFDIQYTGENTGVFTNIPKEKTYNYNGTSPSYSVSMDFYLLTGELCDTSEFRIQLGTLWSYYCTFWLQDGQFDVCYFGFNYSNRPASKFSVKIEPNSMYRVQMGAIKVIEGEWVGYTYSYLIIDGNTICSFYAYPGECVSEDYVVAFKAENGYTMADISLAKTIEYMYEGEVYKTVNVAVGASINEPEVPSKPGYYFSGWYTSETGGERVDFRNKFTSNTDVKYYARFSDTQCKVDFYNGESIYETTYVGKDGLILKPEDPSKIGTYGFDFDKWVIKGTDTEFDFSSPITTNLELEAIYEEHRYGIYYLVDGIKYTLREYIASDPETIIDGEPEVPSIAGTTGHWVYTSERNHDDVYAYAVYDGVLTTPSNAIKLDKYNGETVDIADDLTRYYLSFVDSEEQAKWIETYPSTGGHERQNISFTWTDSEKNNSYLVFFADNEAFENAFIVETKESSIDYVGIFTPGETYYWKVFGKTTNKWSEVDTFTILDSPVRWISAGTVYNMRDLGGWTTTDGNVVNYGLIYRGGQLRLDFSYEESYLNEYAYKVFSYLRINTEIELRGESEHKENQINELNYLISVNGKAYTIFSINDSSKGQYKEVFTALADKSNYPFYFHCSWGADRTGTLGFLINGLLGVPYEQLAEDYELTSLSYSGRRTRYGYSNGAFNELYVQMMRDYANGGTLQDAITRYLIEYIGVTQEEIDSIKNIMLSKNSSTLKSHVVTYMVDGKVYQQSKVFDGGTAKEISPVFYDKHLVYWTLNDVKYDLSTPITSDITLVAVFEKTNYEEYDLITLSDLGLEDGNDPALGPYSYTSSTENGNRMFEFNYKVIAEDGTFDDGVHVEIGANIWQYQAHLWIQGMSSQHVFIDGDDPTNSLTYSFEYGKTYKISFGIVTPLDGEHANKQVLIFAIDDVILSILEVDLDLTTNSSISFAGTEGKLCSTNNEMTVTFKNEDGSVIETYNVKRGATIEMIDDPTKDGKLFVGWFDANGKEYISNSKVYGNITLYARFANPIVINVIDDEGVKIADDIYVKAGTKVSELTIPTIETSTAESYEFVGWYNGNNKLGNNSTITETMELNCRFKLVHDLIKVEAKAETCECDGNIEYYYCSVCGKKFDASGNELDDIVILKHHTLEKVVAKEETCATNGNIEHYHCSECGKNFDENGEELDNVVILKHHVLTLVEAKEATCEEEGNIQYYHCTECFKNYLDDKGTTLATNIVIPIKDHEYGDDHKCITCGKDDPYYEAKDSKKKGCKNVTTPSIAGLLFLAFTLAGLKKKKTNYLSKFY